MNKRDRDNLNFLRSLSGAALTDWAKTVTSDDLDYAIELMQRATTEYVIRELEEIEEIEDLDLSEAQELFQRIAAAA